MSRRGEFNGENLNREAGGVLVCVLVWCGLGVAHTRCLSGAVELCVPDLLFYPRLFSCVLRAFREGDLNYATPKVDMVWVLNMDTVMLPRQAALSHLAGPGGTPDGGIGQGSFSQTSWASEAFVCLLGGGDVGDIATLP